MRPVLAAGRKGDVPQAPELPKGHRRGRVGAVVADAACDRDEFRAPLRRLRAGTRVEPNQTRKDGKRHGREPCRRRNKVERSFGRTERFRRAATRREHKAENFMGLVWLAAVLVDLPQNVHAA